MGIPEESLPRIFERFYRVPENNQAAAGTGLGLAFVQHIVSDVHGGNIGVTSKVGEGTCFTVTLPVGQLKGVPKRSNQNQPEDEAQVLVGSSTN